MSSGVGLATKGKISGGRGGQRTLIVEEINLDLLVEADVELTLVVDNEISLEIEVCDG